MDVLKNVDNIYAKWFVKFTVKLPRRLLTWYLGFPPDVKLDRAGPHGLHRNLPSGTWGGCQSVRPHWALGTTGQSLDTQLLSSWT